MAPLLHLEGSIVRHDSIMILVEIVSSVGLLQFSRKVISLNIGNVQKQAISENIIGQGHWNRWSKYDSFI